jgi:hypothetical protein
MAAQKSPIHIQDMLTYPKKRNYPVIVYSDSTERTPKTPGCSITRYHDVEAKTTLSYDAFTGHLGHLAYLNRVAAGVSPLISTETAELAKQAWSGVLSATAGDMPVPAACTGPDGEMFYSWDRGRHHLELEIIPGQPAEFFYRDRKAEEFWGEDYTIGNPLPARVIEKLPLFR